MSGAGRRRRRIAFERATFTTNDHNERVPSWVPIGGAMAEVFYGRGEERREAASERASQAASFRVLASATTRKVTARDRIRQGTRLWDIIGLALDTPRMGEIEFTALDHGLAD